MTFTHELSDFASRLRVAYIAKDLAVAVRLTRLTLELSGLFYRQGFIQSFSIQNSRKILIRLKYSNNRPLLKKITVISTPGRRVY
jgi:ribosomal protein S8